jgi:hypothetical protein
MDYGRPKLTSKASASRKPEHHTSYPISTSPPEKTDCRDTSKLFFLQVLLPALATFGVPLGLMHWVASTGKSHP